MAIPYSLRKNNHQFDNFIMWWFNWYLIKRKSLLHEVLLCIIIFLIRAFIKLAVFPFWDVKKLKVFLFLSDPNLVRLVILVTSLHKWTGSRELQLLFHHVVEYIDESIIAESIRNFFVGKCESCKALWELSV